jgi:hypothetical protein
VTVFPDFSRLVSQGELAEFGDEVSERLVRIPHSVLAIKTVVEPMHRRIAVLRAVEEPSRVTEQVQHLHWPLL